MRYGDLLPDGALAFLAGPEDDSAGWGAPGGPELVGAGEEAATHVDVPLVVRETIAPGVAVAFVRRIEREYRLISLDGQPHLRAALYESLIEPKHRASWLRLFRGLDPTGFRLLLRLRRAKTWGEGGESTEISVHTRRVEIRINRISHDGTSEDSAPAAANAAAVLSFTLPDEEAKRARLRDRVHRSRLTLSPAYQAPLRDRRLFPAE